MKKNRYSSENVVILQNYLLSLVVICIKEIVEYEKVIRRV